MVFTSVAIWISIAVGAQQPKTAPTMPKPESEKRVGILVFPGVQVIDFSGPYEVLSQTRAKSGKMLFEVVTVGKNKDEFHTSPPWSGFAMRAQYTTQDCPKLEVLVVPGGSIGSVQNDPEMLAWVTKQADAAECVMSVCNGAFILQKAGLLKNLHVTTNFQNLDEIKRQEPSVTVDRDARFVDNGKIITTAGLSSGIDGSLHLIERFSDRFSAKQTALGIEYNWQPEARYTRGSMADQHLVRMLGRNGFEFADKAVTGWHAIENDGTREKWTKTWEFGSALSETELLKVFNATLAKSWKEGKRDGKGTGWTFDTDKGPWTATSTLARLSGDQYRFSIVLSVHES